MKTIRRAAIRDLPDLVTLDIKTHYLGWTETAWRRALSQDAVFIACKRQEPIGFIVISDHAPTAIIRRCGAVDGSKFELIDEAVGYAEEANHTGIEYIVSEREIEPGLAEDASQPLKDLNFTAVVPLLDGYFKIDGDDVAGVKFVRNLNVDQRRNLAANQGRPTHG
ncbi:MAG: hypothetical protein KDA84_14000 [Planctomycetaceae bacterium]|nr:hypothetical protein [Planctomycetaceae bacterium]